MLLEGVPRIMVEEEDYWTRWHPAIFSLFCSEAHCLLRGCGKETFHYWFYLIPANHKIVKVNPKFLKCILLKGAELGALVQYRNFANYRCYRLTDLGIEKVAVRR